MTKNTDPLTPQERSDVDFLKTYPDLVVDTLGGPRPSKKATPALYELWKHQNGNS